MSTAELAAYIVEAIHNPLPPGVEGRARIHILDSIAAVAAGSTLEPGVLARNFVLAQNSNGPSRLIGSPTSVPASQAAFAHGMAGHADESDDSHEASMSHPGCSIVPASFAIAERCDRSLEDLTRAVALGYDVGTRVVLAIGSENIRPWDGIENSHAIAGVFGSAAAATALLSADPVLARTTLSYAAQQAAGLGTAFRDKRHVEKAFVFGGMPARNGVLAAELVAAGFTGVEDVFEGSRNFFHRFRGEANAHALIAGLGERFEIAATNIKRYSVGSPNQTILQSVESLISDGLKTADVAAVVIELPDYVLRIVDSAMPDISARYLVAATLLDGAYSFEAAHDNARMQSPDVLGLMERITVKPWPDMGRSRAARVSVELRDGRTVRAQAHTARGTVHDPMTSSEVIDKALPLLALALPESVAQAVARKIIDADGDEAVRELMDLLGSV